MEVKFMFSKQWWKNYCAAVVSLFSSLALVILMVIPGMNPAYVSKHFNNSSLLDALLNFRNYKSVFNGHIDLGLLEKGDFYMLYAGMIITISAVGIILLATITYLCMPKLRKILR